MEQETNKVIRMDHKFTHRKGGRYVTLDTCMVKIDGEWVPGVSYCGIEGTEYGPYVRTKENFLSGSFTPDPIAADHHQTKMFTPRLDVYDRIQKLQGNTDKDDYQVLAAMSEELGELAGAMAIEDKLHGKAHKTVDEPSTHEACDVVITALALFAQRGGTKDELNIVIHKKLDKWENNIKPAAPLGEDCTNYLVGNCEEVCKDCECTGKD